MKKIVLLATFCALTAVPFYGVPHARAESELKEDMKEGMDDVKKSARKQTRAVKDKTCELVNGKMECAGKKLKHRAQDLGDEVKDKVN